MKFCSITLLVAALFCTCARGDETQFTNRQAVSLQGDKAYILVRTVGRSCGFANIVCFTYVPLFIRELSREELDRADALAREDPDHWKDRVELNVAEPATDQFYAEEGEERFLLISVKPGTYVLGALAGGERGAGGLFTSLCMGTVKFAAKPNVITDLGTIVWALDEHPTSIPELSNYVTGSRVGNAPGVDVAIRLASSTTEVPETLKSLPILPADYAAVPRFPNYIGGPLGRLAPLDGVLSYSRDGQVIDLKSGQGVGH